MSETPDIVKLDILETDYGVFSAYLDNKRITGRETKPLGGGKLVISFTVRREDILSAIGMR